MRTRLIRGLPIVMWFFALAIILVLLAFPMIRGRGISEVLADPVVIVFFVFVLAFVSVGALVATKRPENPLGWLMLAAGIAYSVAGFATAWVEDFMSPAVETSVPANYLAWLTSWAWGIGPFLSATFLLLLFPDGHLPSPRWSITARILAAGLVLFFTGLAFAPGPMDVPRDIVNPLGIGTSRAPFEVLEMGGALICFLGIPVSVASLFVRYRRSVGQTRLQIKWIAYAAGAVALCAGTGFTIEAFARSGVAAEISNILISASLTTLPVAIGFAILRYRLYDIDRIINRTIVYALVTGSALVVYAGTVFVVGTVVVGPSDNLTVAVATLAAAAVFRPALQRVQALVDRRFYRRKYDAQRTVDQFGARLREETDLDELTGDLVGVVNSTMQPEHVSVWLKTQGAGR